MKKPSKDHNKHLVGFKIIDITWDGHDFLNNIKEPSIWEATKNGAKKIGTTSASAIAFIAKEIVKNLIASPQVIFFILNNLL